MNVNNSLVFLAFFLSLTSCSDTPATSNSNTDSGNEPDSMMDVGEDVESDTVDECVPAVCVDVCGTLDDGCGGSIDCGPCPCTDGVVEEPACGECGLGLRSCEVGETGTGTCSIESLGGNCDTDVIYVSENADGDGTRSNPYGSLTDALEDAGMGNTIVVRGDFVGPVTVSKPVKLYGGYDENWSPTGRSEILGGETDEGVFGIIVDSEGVTLQNWNAETPDAATPVSNYAIYAADVIDLVLVNIEATAGRGGDGADGVAGEIGADGEDGINASAAIRANPPTRTPAATTLCSSGGFGGAGADFSGAGTYSPTEAGESVDVATGGGGASSSMMVVAGAGQDGADGSSGQSGQGGLAQGEVGPSGLWVSNGQGRNGIDGESGKGGAGGGGSDVRTNPVQPGVLDGTAGGSGGAGGCAGLHGSGGQGGGGSFGIFLHNVDVTISDSHFSSAFGGSGGDGSQGGTGGRGGRGGDGTSESCFIQTVTGTLRCIEDLSLYSVSGEGGDGGRGGNGGAGGGGAGGPSFGAFCSGSTVVFDDDVTFESAGSAFGGVGFQGSGNGQNGVSAAKSGCP